MTYSSVALSFVEPSCRGHFAPTLETLFSRLHVEAEGNKPPALRIRASSVADWWFCWIEGQGRTVFSIDPQSPQSTEHALLMLSLRGYNRALGPDPFYPAVGEIQLSRWDRMDDVLSAGDFGYLCAYIPRTQLESLAADSVPYGQPAESGSGVGAVLAGSLRALVTESLMMRDPLSLSAVLPDFTRLTLKALGTHPQQRDTESTGQRRLARMLGYLQDHLGDPQLSALSVSRACCLSERQVYREFAANGDSFASRLKQLRVQKAAQLLLQRPATPINMIAYECGFTSSTIFGRAIRDAYGMTPSEFRISRGNGGPH